MLSVKVEFEINKDIMIEWVELPIDNFAEIEEENMSIDDSDELIKEAVVKKFAYDKEDIKSIKVKLDQPVDQNSRMVSITKKEYNRLKEIERTYNYFYN